MKTQRGKHRQKLNMYESWVFAIRIQGELDEHWSEYFGAQSMSVEADEAGFPVTSLISEPVDQAALIGMINSAFSAAGVKNVTQQDRPTILSK
jgi:hypothetical protein